LKSEVKKKMTLNEHATHTPKSLCRAQVENFLAGSGLISSTEKKPGAKLEENLCSRLVAFGVRLQKQDSPARRDIATEFILFVLDTSIIDKREIIAGAHKWLLSTML
jgi:hypothetical protein